MLQTERLILRPWQPGDRQALFDLCSDPKVMRYFPHPLSQRESDELLQRLISLIAKREGWGFWAAEAKHSGEVLGFIGLHEQDKHSGIPGSPFVEIGWRLKAHCWGQGLAMEGANANLDYAFEILQQPKVCAFTTVTNSPSRRVMEKIGMRNTQQDFDHPKLEVAHPLSRHCLYQITYDEWLTLRQGR
ncbi:GNAT family N-acetyltransferase [Vibrio olivae]|uniref:GNAT family N-acetyltransferase n=1 Tax=Vibrio olivae TaxID=1243002 RepID=A0ABV5HHL4_9VIBR